MNLIPQSNSPYRLIPKYLLPYFHFEYWEKLALRSCMKSQVKLHICFH